MDGDGRTIVLAEQLLELRRFVEAESEFGRALAHDPSSARVLRGLGRALLGQDRLAEAEHASRRALDQDPEDVDSLHVVVDVYCARGHAPAAVRYAERALHLDPHSFLSHYQYGRALLLLPDGRVQAERAARHAIRLDPHRADGHNLLGLSLAAQGRRREARKSYAEALALDPHHTLAKNNLAVTAMERGGLARSAWLLRGAASTDPQERLVHHNLDAVLRGLAIRVVLLLLAGIQLVGTVTTMFDLTWWPRALLGLGCLALTFGVAARVARRLPRGLVSARSLRGWREVATLALAAILSTSLVLLSVVSPSAADGPAFAVALGGVLGWPVLIGGFLGTVFATSTQH